MIGWANGSTGWAPDCSPFDQPSPFVDSLLAEWTERGYAVVRTNYQGWDDGRPLLHGRANAEALIDAITAAHEATGELTTDWIALGHSEGGAAVMWAADLAASSDSPFPLKGAVAYAPTGPGVGDFLERTLAGEPVPQGAQPLISITALGAHVVDDTIDLDRLITDAMRPQLDRATISCLPDLAELPQIQAGNYLHPGTDADKLLSYAREQDPSRATVQVPVAIFQGGEDQTTVTPATTEAMIRELCARSDLPIEYHYYPDADHRSVATLAQESATPFDFARTAVAGTTPSTVCGSATPTGG